MTLERGYLLDNRYRIAEILGQGGMGSVYRAVDENLGVDVAVKENLFTTEEYARQFRLEAVILANLRHPNLPRVTDHFVMEDKGQYLVMDYIEGEDLRQRMERTGTLPHDEVIVIGAAMCDALGYLHTRKPPILHRDVKPGNVKITSEGEVFLVDFGLAKVIQGSQVTTTGARAMTPGYSPPEQYGTARTDPRTDVYSLGATLYAALTGIIPEDGLARAMDNAELTPVRKRASKTPRRLAAAIEKAMSIDSDDRFQKDEDFKKALLSTNSKTQRLSGDYTVAPSPVIEDNDDAVEISAATNVISEGVPLVAANNTIPTKESAETPRKKRRKNRWAFIRFLLWLILIAGGVAGLALYYPTISSYAVAWLNLQPTATQVIPVAIPTETETPEPVVEETAEPTATSTIEPTATFTPLPTFTPTLTPPPTFTPTPIGGSTGQIAFVSDRTGVSQVYLGNVDSNGTRVLTQFEDGACQPDWSPDGTQLVFVSPCESGQDILENSSLYILTDLESLAWMQLPTVPGGDFEPAWSPDGTHIAFTSLRDGYMQIYSINLEDNAVQRLTETVDTDYARQPAWSPSGNQIAYSLRRYSSYQIWAMTSTGQAAQQVTRSGGEYWDMQPEWSPDGEMIIYVQNKYDLRTNLWAMNIRYEDRGSAGARIQAEPLPITNVDYSQDGFWFIFEGVEELNRDVYIMTATGSSRSRITTDPGDDFDPVWRPLP